MKKISVIVPCYNEEECIPYFDEAIREVAHTMREYLFEILYINDGSTDATLQSIKSLRGNEQMEIRYVSFSRNFGKEAAMYAGFVNATGDYVAVMDADLQDPPSLLPQMAKILEGGEYDSVATRRATRKGEPKLRSYFARKFYQLMNRISDADMVDGARDFRLMKREMADVIVRMSENCRFSKGIFGWIGFRTYWISYDNIERVAGKTKWSFWKLFKYSLEGIVNFSQTLLSFSSYFGLLILLVSIISMVCIIVRRLLFGDPVQGWASTVSIILFVSGVQLFCTSIIGQYLGRIYKEVKHRPHYIASDASDERIQRVQ